MVKKIIAKNSAEERLRRLEEAYAIFLASIKEINSEQERLGKQTRLILEKGQIKKILQKIVSIK